MGAHNLFASEENIVDTIETILSDLEPLLKSDLVREDRIRKSTEVVFRFNKAVSYSVVKVQAEPFIGELNETAAWVILRKVNDQYYLPRYDRADELPAEVSYLLFQLDPLHLQEKSTSPFVRASYQNSDWLRPNAVTPSSYEKIRNSSAMQMSQLKKPLRKSLDVKCEGKLVIDSDGTRHFDRAKMIPYKGLWMMYLYGSPEEMACQRGGLVSDIILETSFPIYANRIDRAIEQSPLVRTAPFLVDLLKLYIDDEYFSTLEKNLTPEDHRKAIAFAKGANVSLEHVYKAVLLPDVGQFLLAQSYSAMAKVIGAFGALPGLGCSTFVVPPAQSENGQLIGRNLDYDGGGYFDGRIFTSFFR
ncbi:MAG: hypothetical protein J0L93_10445 [Deltaproteobacteria bacterium]|nr:hypothetical protein [Deltaproteobacteria bacterium]